MLIKAVGFFQRLMLLGDEIQRLIVLNKDKRCSLTFKFNPITIGFADMTKIQLP